MKVEVSWNVLDKDWWFHIGVSYDRTYYNEYKRVILIALGVVTIYIRFQNKIK